MTARVTLLSSGGYTFTLKTAEVRTDEIGTTGVDQFDFVAPSDEGYLSILRCGLMNDGPFGIEFESTANVALPVERGLWWSHALYVAARYAERLNARSDAQDG